MSLNSSWREAKKAKPRMNTARRSHNQTQERLKPQRREATQSFRLECSAPLRVSAVQPTGENLCALSKLSQKVVHAYSQRSLGKSVYYNNERSRVLDKDSESSLAPSPREARAGRGLGRGGSIKSRSLIRASSPRPSPPSDGGEGVVAATPRWVYPCPQCSSVVNTFVPQACGIQVHRTVTKSL